MSTRTPGPFTFCTKHKGSFYASCKCPIPGTKKAQKQAEKDDEESSMVEDPKPQGVASLDL